jgi:hypothetical protein
LLYNSIHLAAQRRVMEAGNGLWPLSWPRKDIFH